MVGVLVGWLSWTASPVSHDNFVVVVRSELYRMRGMPYNEEHAAVADELDVKQVTPKLLRSNMQINT